MRSYRFYGKNKPNNNEIVKCIITETLENVIKLKLVDYLIDGIITWQNLTKKKRARNMRHIAKVGQEIYAKIDNIDIKDQYIYVEVVKSYLNDDDDDVLKFKEEQKSNKKLESLVKQISNKFNKKFNDIWENVIHKIDIKRNNDNSDLFLFDFIKNNKNLLLDNFDNNEKKFINEYFDNYMNLKNIKLKSEIGIITNDDTDKIIEIFDNCLEGFEKYNISIKILKVPYFSIESLLNNSSPKIHEELIDKIKLYINDLNDKNLDSNKKTYIKINKTCY